jgi:hypothetical protein
MPFEAPVIMTLRPVNLRSIQSFLGLCYRNIIGQNKNWEQVP